FSPGGTLIARYALGAGADPTSVSTGPNGTVWVAATGAKKLVWFDALAAAPTAHAIDTSGISGCGPAAITDGGNGKMYFSMPNVGAGACPDVNRLGVVAADGATAPTQFGSAQTETFSLLAFQGKLYVPDSDGSRVLRLNATGAVEATVTTPNMSPDGVAIDSAGYVWVGDSAVGQVARYPSAMNSGSATVLPVTGGKLAGATAITSGTDGSMYVVGYDSGTVVRFGRDLSTRVFSLPGTGAQPYAIARGTGGSFYVSDQHSATWYRLYNAAPGISGSSVAPTASVYDAATGRGIITETVSGVVDSGGNDTSVVVDYGTTTDYGQTIPLAAVPASTGVVDVRGAIGGLPEGTVYHARLRVTNAEGTTSGPDVTFTTPVLTHPAPILSPPAPTVSASLAKKSFKTKGKSAGTTLSITVSPAAVAATAKISLQAKGVQKTSKKTKAKSCVAPPKRKVKGQKSCTRLIAKGTVNLGTLRPGANTVAFTGKVGKKTLAPGKYTMVITAGTASAQPLTFTVKR
ncbi:MAG: hypothetical protein AAGC46_08225, partial [Solirubrobacteraceae bacterium]|nr:hypothetical protein [Patulibacter sp.]